MSVTTTQPTTVREFRRLSTAFLSGSRFAAGTEVYVVMSRSGLMPITAIIATSSGTAEDDVEFAMAHPVAQDETPNMATYLVVVPEGVNRLNRIAFGVHGATGCALVQRRGDSAAQPSEAVLGNIASSSVHITWTNSTTSVYDLPDIADAVFFTRGAMELFAFSVYQAMYGTDYVNLFKESID